jgi:hypothetical protein
MVHALIKLLALNSNNNQMKKLLLLCLPFATTMALAQKTDEAAKYAALITPQALKEKLTILASADMEGRETASPGQKKAAAWIEAQFKSFGLKPGNGDSYQQLYPVYQDQLTAKKLMVNGKTFEWDKDYSFGITNADWKYNEFAFAGYGVYDSAKNINDFAALDLKGKVVVILETPMAPGQNMRAGFALLQARQRYLVSKGAVGMLTVADFSKRNPTNTKGGMRLAPPAGNNPAVAPFFTATISNAVASALFGRTNVIPLADLKDVNKGSYYAELAVHAERTNVQLESSNVIGILPGTSKKEEFVFLTGHYDHLGKNGNVIYYGADDDGSGSVGVIQMAEAFAAAAKGGNKPKRTMIFMTVSGEEKGLLGSEYYSEHPTVDMAKASADLNTDMIGRGDSSRKGDTLNYIYVIGHDKLSSDLAPINEAVNKQYTNIALDYKYDDPKDVNRIYYRSDHYNFAKKGVPILFFYDGMLGADYHRPTDTVDKIQFDIMAKRAQLVFHTGWIIANRDEMLKRDIPLNMPGR